VLLFFPFVAFVTAGIGGINGVYRWTSLVGGTDFMAKKKSKREYVWLECTGCGQRNYRTSVSVAEGTPKLKLKKFCRGERKHTVHKIRRK